MIKILIISCGDHFTLSFGDFSNSDTGGGTVQRQGIFVVR